MDCGNPALLGLVLFICGLVLGYLLCKFAKSEDQEWIKKNH